MEEYTNSRAYLVLQHHPPKFRQKPVAIATLQLIVKVLYVVVYTGYQLSNYYVGIRLSPIYARIS